MTINVTHKGQSPFYARTPAGCYIAQQLADIENNLGVLRQKRGLSAIHLAKMVGISRQTIYAIESGTYVPNTTIALKLARALDSSVDDLFALATEPPTPSLRTEQALLLPGSETLQAGQPVQLCQVDKRLIASSPSPLPWYFPGERRRCGREPEPRR